MTIDVHNLVSGAKFKFRNRTFKFHSFKTVRDKTVIFTDLKTIVLFPNELSEIENFIDKKVDITLKQVDKVIRRQMPKSQRKTKEDSPNVKRTGWEHDEDEFLKRNYQDWGVSKISTLLNRTTGAVLNRASKLKLRTSVADDNIRMGRWSEYEDEFVIKNYKKYGSDWISMQIPRTTQSITARASRLKVTRQNSKSNE
jgi:hypothetical protein